MNKKMVSHKVISLFLLMPLASMAEPSINSDPRHLEIFNSWNFCIYCNLNDELLSPETLYGRYHRNANISASYVYDTTMDNLDLTFAFMYSIRGERFAIKNSEVEMINLTYSDLPYFTFTGNEGKLVNFTGSGLNYGNLTNAQLDYPIFSETSLIETNFSGAQFNHARFNRTRMTDANLSHTHLVQADFTDADLVRADFTGAVIENSNFTRADLSNAKITEQQLATSIICDAILPDGSLGEC